ncbi:hypothetical protein AB4Y88_09270 [Paenarthrobacter sp. RAF9]
MHVVPREATPPQFTATPDGAVRIVSTGQSARQIVEDRTKNASVPPFRKIWR